MEERIHEGRVVNFVVDFSQSIHGILPAIAVTCFDIMNRCLLGDEEQTTFGLVIYGNEKERLTVFSENPSKILEQMLSAKVGGGSENGVEDTAAALRLACESMQKIALEEGFIDVVPPEKRVLFLFTDSLTNGSVNLKKMSRSDGACTDCPPVRAAVLFVPTETKTFQKNASRYQLPLVDEAGKIDRHRAPYIFPLEKIVSERILGDEEQDGGWISQLLAAIS